ncbi:hypothetical protein [Bosea sp. BK604]|uniref:hypothetical protein n=1 Tax=Bosea sp. BK604 TaxID=2512180 RepID=UPI00104313AA|nr:hypothetical protein [Bosea sp. BK604]TCR68480.1 hypothetical protein EV560_102308 [Bosea sp. BK604]
MTRTAQRARLLEGLFLDLFQHPRDLRKIWGATFGERANADINWDKSLRDVVFDIILWLQSRGTLSEFLSALGNARAGRRSDIAQIADLFSVPIEVPGGDNRSALHVLLLRFDRLMATERELRLERTLEKHLARFAEGQGMEVEVTSSDDEAPADLAGVLKLGQRFGADIVIWGDLYDLTNAVEFELRWASAGRVTFPSAAQPDGTTGISSIQSLSTLTSGRLLGHVDFLVAWISGMQRFNSRDYEAAVRFFESAIRFVPGSFEWTYRVSLNERGFAFSANRPWVDALAFLALSYQRAGKAEKAIPLWNSILTIGGENSQGSFNADPFAIAAVEGDAEQVEVLALATLQYAHALQSVGQNEEALAAYKKLQAVLSKRGTTRAHQAILNGALNGFADLADSMIAKTFGKSVDDEIQTLLLFDGMAVPAELAEVLTGLSASESERLFHALAEHGFMQAWAGNDPLLRFDPFFLPALRQTDLDREAEILRRLSGWLGQRQSEVPPEDQLWPAIQYLLDSGPAFFTIEEAQKSGLELSGILPADRSAWWVEAVRNSSPQAPSVLTLVLLNGGFRSARAPGPDVVIGFLRIAIEARRNAIPLAQQLTELGVVPRAWDLAPDWLRRHMTLLATPGIFDHSTAVPIAYLTTVGKAWMAVAQERPASGD